MNAFCQIWSNGVIGVEFGGVASDRPVLNASDVTCHDYYFNFVSELWYMVALTIECGQFRGMTEEVMLEGCMREWGYQGRRIQVEPKDKMKVKTGRSPDLFDTLVVGLEMARRHGFIIVRNTATAAWRDDKWKDDLRERADKVRKSFELQPV